jgi:hypothetical protein
MLLPTGNCVLELQTYQEFSLSLAEPMPAKNDT